MRVEQNQPKSGGPNQCEWVKAPVANPCSLQIIRHLFRPRQDSGQAVSPVHEDRRDERGQAALGDFIKDRQDERGDDPAILSGQLTMGDAVDILRQRLDEQPDIKNGAKDYWRRYIQALLKSWPGLESKPVGKVGKDDGRVTDASASPRDDGFQPCAAWCAVILLGILAGAGTANIPPLPLCFSSIRT